MPSLADGIVPGSTEYGDRQTLEEGLQGVGGGAPLGGGSPSPQTSMPAGNPLGRLLSGGVTPADEPLTAGLSVGPGPGPQGGQTLPGPLDNDLGNKLRLIASQASSPVLRTLAQTRLRRMYREGQNGQ